MMRLALAVAAAGSRAHTSLSASVCSELLAPRPGAPAEEHDGHEERRLHESEEHFEESAVGQRCAAHGIHAPDCAFFHEVLHLTHEQKGAAFEEHAFCTAIQAVVDCSQLLGHVLTSTTVQDLVEAECLKHHEDVAYCTELKVSVGGNDRNEDAKGLWQCYKAQEAARAEREHRAHADAHEAHGVEEVGQVEELALEGEASSGGGEMLAALAVVLVAGGLLGAYQYTRPRIVSLDDALISNEGYSQVLDAYNRAYA
jgi:hypothetical protein